MVFGGKFRIRRCNSKASYLPRQSLEKLNNTDPDHGSYKLTLTSNEDLVASAKPPSYDILAHNGKPLPSNLPDVLPLGAKLQPQPASPTSANGSPLRYGSNNNLAPSNSPTQQQQQQQQAPPAYSLYPPAQHRYSTPALNSYNISSHYQSYSRSQSFDVNANAHSPSRLMSQSTNDLKKTPNLDTTLEEGLSPAQSEASLNSGSAAQPLSPTAVARNEFNRLDSTVHAAPPPKASEEQAGESEEGRIFRAEVVNATLPMAPCPKAHKTITRQDSLRENIEKITQLQSQLMSAHLADTAILSGYAAKPNAPNHTQSSVQPTPTDGGSSVEAAETALENDVPPSLPSTPPPPSSEPPEFDDAAAMAQISQMDTATDGLKLMQRSELVLRVHATTTETASQTDDLPDGDIGRMTVNTAREEQPTRTTLQPRQRLPIELECEAMARELAELLASNEALVDLLAPQRLRTPADYVGNLYNPNVPLRPGKRDVGTSTLMRMKDRGAASAAENATPLTMELQYAEIEVTLTNGSDADNCNAIKRKVDEYMRHLNRKISVLGKEQATITEECAVNDELGVCLVSKLAEKVRPYEATKFRTYIDDVGHITSLLLSLSERLARVENSLASLPDSHAEKKLLESKRDRLLEQLEEAKRLKDDIERRGASVSGMLERNLSADAFADFEYFINMKAKLIADVRDIADKIKSGEEQLSALSEALTQSDC